MTAITVQLESPIRRTFRVEQVAGMFDVPIGERVRHELVAEVPGMEEKWTIGAILGPSGSGKTTLAKAAFGKGLFRRRAWPKDRAIIDCFDEIPVKLLTAAMVSVGLGSPPTWLKPYRVLSTGEKFRAELVRAVLRTRYESERERECERGLVVFDEFSSSLDRTVAKTTSAAVARLLREGEVGRRSASLSHPTVQWPRFVAVTGHRDILPWLCPDWTLELERGTAGRAGSGTLTWGRMEGSSFRFCVERVPQAMWTQFSGEHYLSGGLAASARCYGAFCVQSPWSKVQSCIDSTLDLGLGTLDAAQPVGFCAVVASMGWKATKRIQRLVVLPEFQGLGIGGQLLDEVAAIEASHGNRVTITASHPAVLAHCSKSSRWRLFAVKKEGSTRQTFEGRDVSCSVGRAVAAFEWLR